MLSYIADIFCAFYFGTALIGILFYILFRIFNKGYLSFEERIEKKLDEAIDVLHCVASEHLEREAMRDIQSVSASESCAVDEEEE